MSRPSALVFLFFAAAFGAFALCLADAAWLTGRRAAAEAATAALVERLGLTDLALFTEARYARHLSQADIHSAFQDHPLGLEHFPSGSLVSPPRHDLLDREAASPD